MKLHWLFKGPCFFARFECFITSRCSSLRPSLYDKTRTLQKEQLVYDFIPSPYGTLPPARRMLFIRTWLRAARGHNSSDRPVFDSEEIIDLKYQRTLLQIAINIRAWVFTARCCAGYAILSAMNARNYANKHTSLFLWMETNNGELNEVSDCLMVNEREFVSVCWTSEILTDFIYFFKFLQSYQCTSLALSHDEYSYIRVASVSLCVWHVLFFLFHTG